MRRVREKGEVVGEDVEASCGVSGAGQMEEVERQEKQEEEEEEEEEAKVV